jgi:AraC family transcriptional regulator
MLSPIALIHVIKHLCDNLESRLTLNAIARRSGWSAYHLHRQFRRLTGETPKQFVHRMRVTKAAARLATEQTAIRRISYDAGFRSHEVFIRAFARQFGCTPSAFRKMQANLGNHRERRRQADVLASVAPCISLLHTPTCQPRKECMMPVLSIDHKVIAAQPILFVRSRVARADIAATIATSLSKIIPFAMGKGIALSGQPFSRYPEIGPGLLTIEVGMPVSKPSSGNGEIIADSLPAGPVAMAVHAGPYDQLVDTYAALERWIADSGHKIAGAPWECYVTDPADFPDPQDWRTEVYWPLTE